MRRVLVTGASGFIGRAAVRAFAHAGWRVRAAVRAVPPDADPEIEWRGVGDIEKLNAWSTVADGVDCVIHLAGRTHFQGDRHPRTLQKFRAINVEATRRLAEESQAAGVGRFVFLSSIGVNGQRTPGSAFTENDAPRPELPYAFSKLEAETALRSFAAASGVELVIVRPPLVYGPDAPGNFRRLASWVSRGLPLPLAGVCNRRSFISVQNLVSALVRCADHPRAANETFLVSDGEDVSTSVLVMKIAAALGREARLWYIPQPVLAVLARLGHRVIPLKQLIDSLAVDSSRIRERLDWKPPLGFDEGLRIALTGSPFARRR